MGYDLPKVSCLMVTANRRKLAARAIQCFLDQTYENKELIIIDDGEEDYSPVLTEVPEHRVKYVKLEKEPDFVLGKLRNKSLDEASGDYLVQWDDDDWYHPDRIQVQANVLSEGYDACCLSAALMHLDTPEFINQPYVGYLPDGIPGSIMHRNNSKIRYPETRRAEDTVYLKEWMKLRYKKLPNEFNHLFLRAYHGSNTWEREHFQRRIRNSAASTLSYIWHKKIKGNLYSHPRFQLNQVQQEAFDAYFDLSRKLSLF